MARPRVWELTERELEVMHEFWELGEATVAEIRDAMAAGGRELAYTTVATLVRILTEKKFLQQTNEERPFQYQPVRTFEEVSRSIVGDVLNRLFSGSREQFMLRLLEQKKLTKKERRALEDLLGEDEG